MSFLLSILRAIRDFFVGLFRRQKAQEPPPVEPLPMPEPAPLPPSEPDPISDPYPMPPPEPIPVPPVVPGPAPGPVTMPRIIRDYIALGRGNRPGYSMAPLFITIHDTGNPSVGANARAHANYIKGDTAARLPVSWHFTVDDSNVYQHLPLDESGWHAGDGNGQGNRASIGIEICENADGDRAKAEENAALLVAWLHQEVESLLPFPQSMKQHHDWSGKNCPRLIRARPNGWQLFLDSIPLASSASKA